MPPVLDPVPDDDPAQAAADWVVRLTRAKPSDHTIAAFQTWRNADLANAEAFIAARAAWTDADRLVGLPSRARRLRRATAATAAALAAGLAIAVVLPMAETVGADLRSLPGEVQQRTLPDGTRIWLDTDTAIDIAYADSGRTLNLRRGRLFVEVAPGDPRPFAIRTEGATITDIGTGFSVDRAGDGFSVQVESGVVDVAAKGRTTRLTAGQASRFNIGPSSTEALNADDLAWRRQEIVLDHMPLKAAVAEIARYRDDRLIWMAGEGDTPVSGLLRLSTLNEGLDTLLEDRGLELRRLPGVTLVVKKS